MPNNEDFFSPDQVDEWLETADFPQKSVNGIPQIGDPNLLLVHDLRVLYRTENNEHAHSLARVWERLAQQAINEDKMKGPDASETAMNIHMPRSRRQFRHEGKRYWPGKHWITKTGKSMRVLAASILILTLVGSMLLVLSVGHHPLLGIGAVNTPVTTPTSATPLQGYPPPGKTIATSPTSPDEIAMLSWAPDGKHLAGSSQGKAWIWDLQSGEYSPIAIPAMSYTPIKVLSWSPDGRYLALGTNPVQVIDTTITIANVVRFIYPIYAFWPTVGNDEQAVVTALTWSHDSNLLAIAALRAGNGCVVQIRDIRQSQDQLANSYPSELSPTGISSVSWSSDGRFLAWADGEAVQVWDTTVNTDTPTPIFKQSISHTTSVAWSPNNPALLAFINGPTAQIWNIEQNNITGWYTPASNGVVAWSPDGYYLATAHNKQIDLWNAHTGVHLYTYTGHTSYVRSLAWSPDGQYLASGESSSPSRQNITRVWSA